MLPLRGLHLPSEPLTIGTADIALAIAAGLAAALVIGSLLGLLVRRRRSVRSTALDKLARIGGLAPGERLLAQATLLRRLVRTLDGAAAARRQGEAWLEQLDRSFRTAFF